MISNEIYLRYIIIFIIGILYLSGIYNVNITIKRVVISILSFLTIQEFYVFVKNKYF